VELAQSNISVKRHFYYYVHIYFIILGLHLKLRANGLRDNVTQLKLSTYIAGHILVDCRFKQVKQLNRDIFCNYIFLN